MPELVGWWTPETTCTAGVTSRAVPGAASHNSIRSRRWPFLIGHFIVGIDAKPVLAPLLDIPGHIMETPGIGFFLSYGLG
jgi:hypothetical protein